MLKKHRQLIIGIVIGFILASSVVLGADVIRNSYFNSELKLAINGHQVEDVRIVTVELEGEQWGRNYYSIADLIKALNDYGGISAKVDFDSETKTTVVEIEQKTEYVTPVPENNSQRKGDIEMDKPLIETITDITDMNIDDMGMGYFYSNGEKYITGVSLGAAIAETKDLGIEIRARTFIFRKSDNSIVLDNIPVYGYIDANGNPRSCIKYDYFANTILPIIEAEKEAEKEAD